MFAFMWVYSVLCFCGVLWVHVCEHAALMCVYACVCSRLKMIKRYKVCTGI